MNVYKQRTSGCRWRVTLALILTVLFSFASQGLEAATATPPPPPPTPTYLPYPSTAYPIPAYIPPRIVTPVPVQVRPLPAGNPGGPVARLFSQVLPSVTRAILGFALIGGAIIACGMALYGIASFLSRAGRWLRDAWAAATRTAPRRALMAGLLLVAAGLAVRAALYQPLVPLPTGSPLAAELWDTYVNAEDAYQRIAFGSEPVTLLASYYADVPGYRWLTEPERARIVAAFGPDRLNGAAMLTAKQANLLAVFGALPAPGVPNPFGAPQLDPPSGYPASPAAAGDRPIAYWTNVLGNRAAMRVVSCGRYDYVFHHYPKGWKIVHIRVLERCRA
jgi:hypothetical protein